MLSTRTTPLALGIALAATASAQPTIVDIREFPDGSVPPPDVVVTDQYRDLGVLFDGRTMGGDPLSLFIGGAGTTGRYLFNTPDVFGATHVYRFVAPGTSDPATVSCFQTSPDFDALGEQIELRGLDAGGALLKSLIIEPVFVPSSPIVLIEADPGAEFAIVEIITSGNPGVGFLGTHNDAMEFCMLCRADLDGDGALTFFDFLMFQNLFAAGDLRADFTGDGRLDFFDFLEFQNQFAAGCP